MGNAAQIGHRIGHKSPIIGAEGQKRKIMQKALANKPTIDTHAVVKAVGHWKLLPTGPGQDRTVIEWGVGKGPNVYVFPAASRAEGLNLVQIKTSGSDERWADFLEHEFVPELEQLLSGLGLSPQVICVDQRPILIMRERRRALEVTMHAHH
jgi:hypothetical protein